MAPLEPWEKVLVNAELFPQTVHGQAACIDCHGGVLSEDKEIAHEGVIRNPSADPESTCGRCHPNIVASSPYSLHNNLTGYWNVLYKRGAPENHPAIETMFNNHCASCHTTCGDCHVSQPNSVGGGFIEGHLFKRTPSMTRNCTACHGSRVGNEYLGKHEGLRADVHFRQGRMSCVNCHSGAQMHGEPAQCHTCHPGPESAQVPPPDHRYAGIQTPRCESCHAAVSTGQDGIMMHEMHASDLSCQVCHSIAYTSCDGCHVAVSETTGNPFFSTRASYLTFLIGRNPIRSYDRPYQFVTLRHVPIDPDSFSYYGENLLPDFDHLETWKYTTPHNIQRITPQAETCDSCHGNADLFLTADKVVPEEWSANRYVMLDEAPSRLVDFLSAPAVPENHVGRSVCLICHQTGANNSTKNPPDHARRQDSECSLCHPGP